MEIVECVGGVVRMGEHAQAFVGSAGPNEPSPFSNLCRAADHQQVAPVRAILAILDLW
ncbi:hypothetical protein GCM10008965_13180 [Methylorubrum aminovorans]